MNTYEKQMIGFQNLYHISGIPFIIATPDHGVVRAFPEGSGIYYQADYWTTSPLGAIKGKHPDGVTLFEVGEFCHVAIVKLDINLFFSTVPVRTSDSLPHSYFPVFQKGIQKERQVDFYRMLLDVPSMTNYQLAEFASLAKMIYCGKPAQGINVYQNNISIQEELSKRMDYLLSLEDFESESHISVSYEQQIAEGISSGNLSATEDALNRSLHGTIGRMSLNDLRQAKYQFICMIFVSCRAAIAAGMPEEQCFQMSDLFCQRMDNMNTVSSVNKYVRECILYFCRLVAEHKHEKAYSSYTKSVLEYINKHLLEPLTMEKISAAVGLNRKSLGKYFQKDTGMTVPKYIQNRRLEEAAYLLKNGNMSISAISELLQFSNQSHFTERFKEKYQTTPLSYRQKN